MNLQWNGTTIIQQSYNAFNRNLYYEFKKYDYINMIFVYRHEYKVLFKDQFNVIWGMQFLKI